MDKSYVTLATCPICQKENGSLLIDRRLRPTFDMHTPILELCEDCKEKYLTKGVLLIAPKTGSLVVLKTEAFSRLFNKPIPKQHIVYCDQEVIDEINSLQKSDET
jgi:hypothetical protein